MILLINFLDRVAVVILLLFTFFLFHPRYARGIDNVQGDFNTPKKEIKIAVLSVDNLSGTKVPLSYIRESFIKRLSGRAFSFIGEEIFEKFIAKHRIRYSGGIDRETAKAFKDEVGVEGVLITAIELFSEMNPPKIALVSRFISTGDNPTILWSDGIGLAGDQSPGILGLGLIEDPTILLDKALKYLSDSLLEYLSTRKIEEETRGVKKKFEPKAYYRSPAFDVGRKYTVAVVPFFNRTERKNAGEIMVLDFIRNLQRFEIFNVIEPGIVRQELLGLRLIMDEGISLANADLIFSVLDADLILSGKVIDYEDPQGSWGTPKVDFSVVIFDKKSRQVVWSSQSYNHGDDDVLFFDWGRVATAHAMVSQMVQAIGKIIMLESR